MPRTACDYILFGELHHSMSIRDAARHLVDELYRRYPDQLRREARHATWLGSRGERYDHRVAAGLYANVARFSRNDLLKRSESLLLAMALPRESFKVSFPD